MSAFLRIAGVVPPLVVTPRDRAELRAQVAEFSAAGTAFAFVGGGTDLELGNPPRALGAAVRMTSLDRVLDYAPEDQTITVEAGLTFAALDRVLAQHGQCFPLDVADRDRTTIGGAIAVDAYGARRHRYGSLKDLIVGVEIVRPDGVVARGGGKVVKNVAGFDLPKLMVGSLGTLGAIAGATFRVLPQPPASAAVVVRGVREHGDALDPLVAALIAAQLEPTSIVAVRSGEGVDTLIAFDGDPAAVAAQVEIALACAAPLAREAAPAGRDDLDAFAAHERRVRSSGAWRARRSTAPSVVNRTRAGASAWLADAVCYPSLGAFFAAGDDPPLELDALEAAVRSARSGSPGTFVFRAMPERWRGRIDAWGEPPPAFPIMRALKSNFDPKGLCNPGRFVGGL